MRRVIDSLVESERKAGENKKSGRALPGLEPTAVRVPPTACHPHHGGRARLARRRHKRRAFLSVRKRSLGDPRIEEPVAPPGCRRPRRVLHASRDAAKGQCSKVFENKHIESDRFLFFEIRIFFRQQTIVTLQTTTEIK